MNERQTYQTRLWLTVPIAILLAIAAGGGVFFDGLYRDRRSVAVQAIGQDLVSLAVVLPALIVSAVLSSRGSHRAQLIWLGGLVYFDLYLCHRWVRPPFQLAVPGLRRIARMFGLRFGWRPGDGRPRWNQGTLQRANADSRGRHRSGSVVGSFLFRVVKRGGPCLDCAENAAERRRSGDTDQSSARAGHGLDPSRTRNNGGQLVAQTAVGIRACGGVAHLRCAPWIGNSINGGVHDPGRSTYRGSAGFAFRILISGQLRNADLVLEGLEVIARSDVMGFTCKERRPCASSSL